MSVRVVEIDAATAVEVVDLAAALACKFDVSCGVAWLRTSK
jgi:hypothetical protein